MVNAIITNKELGSTSDGIPYAILHMNYNDGQSTKSISTLPIFFINTSIETVENSGMARLFTYLLDVIDASTWEDVVGKVVRIDIVNDIISQIYHPINNLYITLVPSQPEIAETEGNTDESD